jgi:outer membrane protein W
MFKAALVGAVALATAGSLTVSHQGIRITPAAAQDVVVSHAQIAHLKSALRLTADQEHLWRPVEASLRAMARQQQQYRVASADGYVDKSQSRLSGYALNAAHLYRLKSAAQPLIGRLNDDQKHAGMQVLQSMGVSF